MSKIFCGYKKNGKRVSGKYNCDHECKHFKKCCIDLGLTKEPRGFKQVPATDEEIRQGVYELNYKGEEIMWVINKKRKNPIKLI